MTELDLISSYNEEQLQTTNDGNNDFKLPKIKNAFSRASVRSKAERKKGGSPYPARVMKNSSSEWK